MIGMQGFVLLGIAIVFVENEPVRLDGLTSWYVDLELRIIALVDEELS